MTVGNGVIHTLDSVMIPPPFPWRTASYMHNKQNISMLHFMTHSILRIKYIKYNIYPCFFHNRYFFCFTNQKSKIRFYLKFRISPYSAHQNRTFIWTLINAFRPPFCLCNRFWLNFPHFCGICSSGSSGYLKEGNSSMFEVTIMPFSKEW